MKEIEKTKIKCTKRFWSIPEKPLWRKIKAQPIQDIRRMKAFETLGKGEKTWENGESRNLILLLWARSIGGNCIKKLYRLSGTFLYLQGTRSSKTETKTEDGKWGGQEEMGWNHEKGEKEKERKKEMMENLRVNGRYGERERVKVRQSGEEKRWIERRWTGKVSGKQQQKWRCKKIFCKGQHFFCTKVVKRQNYLQYAIFHHHQSSSSVMTERTRPFLVTKSTAKGHYT